MLLFDWLTERTRWSYLAHSWSVPRFTRKVSSKAIYWSLYWPSLFSQDGSILATFFFACSYSHRKKNLANIQSSWPHTWSISHLHINGLFCWGHFTAKTYKEKIKVPTQFFQESKGKKSLHWNDLLKTTLVQWLVYGLEVVMTVHAFWKAKDMFCSLRHHKTRLN